MSFKKYLISYTFALILGLVGSIFTLFPNQAFATELSFISNNNSGMRQWKSIASSADGTKLAAITGDVSKTGYIYTSTNSGADWVERTGPGLLHWVSIASSSDGTKLVAVVYGGNIYTSINSGASWTSRASVKDWISVASSPDGIKLAAAIYSGYIFTSTDSGANWVQQTGSNSRVWNSITSTLNGTNLAAVTYSNSNSFVYTSIDSGVTWVQKASAVSSSSWKFISSSSDGTLLVALTDNGNGGAGYLYTSTDGGTTWIKRMTDKLKSWQSASLSSDGTRIFAAGGYLYTSTDSGSTWTEQLNAGAGNWFSVTSSSDGTKLAAVNYNSYIYTSSNAPYVLPVTTTNAASSILQDSSTLNGNISNIGGEYNTIRGFEYGLTTSYGSITTENGSFGTGSFSANLSSLIPNTTYHFKSYSINSVGTAFGPDLTFTTLPILNPTVETYGETLANTTTVTLNGTILNSGGSTLTIRGFEYGLTTSYGSITTENGSFGAGTFSANLSSLTPNTIYHYHAYGTNSYGTSYGLDRTFISAPYIWTEQTNTGLRNWTAITSSSDGVKLAAIIRDGSIYISKDSGLNWSEKNSMGQQQWTSITSSSDGVKLAALTYDGYVYTSTDSGSTWTSQTFPFAGRFSSITSSTDGMKLAIADNMYSNSYIYTSINGGISWTQRLTSGSRYWVSISSSTSGVKLAAAVASGYIYTSTDSGATWAQQVGSGSRWWKSIASSSDGTKLIATVSASGELFGQGQPDIKGYVYTSNNSGVTWTEQTSIGLHFWNGITSSADGMKLAAVSGNNNLSDYIYTSTDGGTTWTQQTSAGQRQWKSISSSSDGVKLVAMNYGGYVYTYSSAPIITTESATLLLPSSIVLNGSIVSMGKVIPTIRGFEYGFDANYANNIEETGVFNEGSFSANITPIEYGTTYYYRSFATNSEGTGYGSDFTFIPLETIIVVPTLTTDSATNITENSAVLNGTITNDAGEEVTVGFKYGKTEDHGTDIAVDGTFATGESFLSEITGLICGTTYYYEAFAENSTEETAFGGDQIFTTESCPHSGGGSSTSSGSSIIRIPFVTPLQPEIMPKAPVCSNGDLFSTLTGEACPIIVTSPLDITRNLKLNMTGDDVKALQIYLNTAGFNCGIVDGKFGPKTKASVILFQKANKLTVDGIVGPKTLEKMK